MKRKPTLTLAENEILYSCGSYVLAGEIEGTNLEGETEAETDRNVRTLCRAMRKLIAMTPTVRPARRAAGR